MNNTEHKNQLPNFSEEKDIYYQEIEKTTFLVESELKDFKELIYLCSNINRKYTALLYCDKEHTYLYLFILKHIIDTVKENVSYKIKAKLVLNKNDIDKTNLEDKQMFIDEQANKNSKNEYKIMLINRYLILLQVTGKKLIIINFDKKEYITLFSNINDKKVIDVVDTYDELIVIKNKENNSNSSRKRIYQIRTYIFCIASGILYFFILNENIFSDLQFLLIPFPFEEEIKDCIDFKILKIMNKSAMQNSPDKKYYFMMIILLNGKLVRYVTDLMNKSLKEILLNFKDLMKNNLIRKSIDLFDKGNNNVNNYHLKIYRSEKCASFIILQIDFHIYTYKFYESDLPEDIIKKFVGQDNGNNIVNIIEISSSNVNSSSRNTIHLKSNNKNDLEQGSETNILSTNTKNISILSNSLNESNSQSNTKINQIRRRHKSISNVNILSQLKNTAKFNNQISNESLNSNGNIVGHNSIDQPESNFNLNDTKDIRREMSSINLMSNNNTKGSLQNRKVSSDKNIAIPELKTKDREVVYYSLYKLHNLDLNEEKEKDKENNKDNLDDDQDKENNDSYKSADELMRNIKYSFTYHNFISFIKNKNSVIVCYIPEKMKDNNKIEQVVKYNRKLSISSDENIQILDILHYDQLKYSFLLTNLYIYKFRVNTDLLHLLSEKNKIVSDDPKNETIYDKLNSIFKYSKNNKIHISEKCQLCKKPENKIMCAGCKRAVYCCKEHKDDDYLNIHFFQCEMNQCISKLMSNKRKSDNLQDFNYVIISFKNILNQIFLLIENKKDYINYSMYLKIMLNVLENIKIENFMNGVLAPLRSIINCDFHQVCHKIFIIELWFFYLNLNILYIDFIIKSEMYVLASKLISKIKIVDLIENKDSKLATMFHYFSLANDLTKYKMNNIKDNIEQYSKNYFFDLLEIYTNGNKDGNYLYIHEQFFRYYLFSFCSLLKINLFLKEKTKNIKNISPINIDKIVYHIPILFEEKLNNAETNNTSELQLKLPLILLYYHLSFVLVKIDKVYTAINLLRYILGEIKNINYKKDVSKINENIVKSNVSYFSLEAKIYLNIGILITYNGNFNLGIHYLENCYRLCFEKKLSTLLSMKVINLLSLAYINYDKIDTAFILLKTGINLTKKFLTVKNNINSTILVKKLLLFKSKIYLLFLYQYISYKYQKMNKVLTTKTKGKNNIIKDPDDIPTSIFPIKFNKMSPALIGYICEEDKNKKLAEVFKEQINKEDETFKFELDSNLDKFVLFCNNWKFDMIIKALEFLYKLSDKEYEILNSDNGAIQKEETKEDNYNNQKERSSIMSRDSSMSYSRTLLNKEKLILNIKDDNENFFDEIEVKIGLYDQLSDLQQKELKSIQNNIFRRSILLRDPKGKIDKFNLNYHPKYTYDFYELFTKMGETIFLNQLEKFGIGEQYEAKIFEHKNDGLIHALRRYLNLEKIQNILYMEKVKLIEKYKNNIIFVQKDERRETVTKNPNVANEYMNKLKEKLGKDKFLKNMNMEGLYEKLLKDLTYRELDYILENPNKILNYIYINSKPLSDEQNSRTNRKIVDNEKNEQNEDEITKEKLRNSNILNKKNIKEKTEEEKNLSPRAIYNNLIDLISEKRKGRSLAKKQTVNYNNMEIPNILSSSKLEEKKINDIKNNVKNKKKKPIMRSTTLTKPKISSLKSKKIISSFPNYMRNMSPERKFTYKSNSTFKNSNKITDFKSKMKIRRTNTTLNIDKFEGSNFSVNNFKYKNLKISKTIPNPLEENKRKSETYFKPTMNKKVNVAKKKYQRDKIQKGTDKEILIYEENISQPKKFDDVLFDTKKTNNNQTRNKRGSHEKINLLGIKTSKENRKEFTKTNDTEYIKKTMEKTFDKYKNKNNRNENNNKSLEKNDDIKVDKKEERKVTYIQRQKPTFKELREKVLHRGNKTNVTTIY